MFGDLHALPPQETLDRIQATVTEWWPAHARAIARAFKSPEIQEWALAVAAANHPESRVKLIFSNLLKPYMAPRRGLWQRLRFWIRADS